MQVNEKKSDQFVIIYVHGGYTISYSEFKGLCGAIGIEIL